MVKDSCSMRAAKREKAERKILVCIEKGCKRCGFNISKVPDDCEYGILHLLECRVGGIQERKRQTGKTTELMAIARLIVDTGNRVYYVTPVLDMSPVGRNFAPIRGMKCCSVNQARSGTTRGFPSGYVVMDEVQPADFEDVMFGFHGSILVAAYYTAMP